MLNKDLLRRLQYISIDLDDARASIDEKNTSFDPVVAGIENLMRDVANEIADGVFGGGRIPLILCRRS